MSSIGSKDIEEVDSESSETAGEECIRGKLRIESSVLHAEKASGKDPAKMPSRVLPSLEALPLKKSKLLDEL